MALKSKLGSLARALEQTPDQIAEQVAQEALEARDNLVPIDEGDLLASGEIEHTGPGARVVREGRGLPDARALFTERGTVKMPAQPHMEPAADLARRRLKHVGTDTIQNAIRKHRL